VLRTLQAAASEGITRAALEVDESSHSNATDVYRRIGFEVIDRSLQYVKEL
jgi:hypothetical protein